MTNPESRCIIFMANKLYTLFAKVFFIVVEEIIFYEL